LTTFALSLWISAETQPGAKAPSGNRYGVELDAKKYPQATPKDALASVLKAVAEKQYAYMLAHLVDPDFVQERVAQNAKKFAATLSEDQKQALAFEELAKTTAEHFVNDPTKLKDLQRFDKEGEWTETGKDAGASVKGSTRKVYMKQIAPDRWVLLDRQK
jgi:hypothetical protein